MKSEKEKMLGGELYNPLDPKLFTERQRVRLLFKAFNDTSDDQRAERLRLLQEIIPMAGKELWIEPPFYCDYGINITIGDNVFFNFNCVILDIVPVTIQQS
jgi:maltose O-acetyltransferase